MIIKSYAHIEKDIFRMYLIVKNYMMGYRKIMKKLIISVLVLTTFSAFAAPATILEKSQVSGFVQPQFRFAKSCLITSNGRMRIEIKKPDETGEWQSKVTNIQLSQNMTEIINNNLFGAAHGEIISLPMPCDVGSKTLHGYYKGRLIEIDSAVDCHSHTVNKSEAAKNLKEISLKLCKF